VKSPETGAGFSLAKVNIFDKNLPIISTGDLLSGNCNEILAFVG
jgi:hypothetical protein